MLIMIADRKVRTSSQLATKNTRRVTREKQRQTGYNVTFKKIIFKLSYSLSIPKKAVACVGLVSKLTD